jgi:hypothetical protein
LFNGVIYDRLKAFKPIPGHIYYNFYDRILKQDIIKEHAELYLNQPGKNKYDHTNNAYLQLLRKYLKEDLFFMVHFALGADCNDPRGFVIDKCYEIEADSVLYNQHKQDSFHYVWARGHFKSTLITMGSTAQYHLNNPEHSTCIFSFKKGNANKFLSTIGDIYQMDEVKHAFQDLLWNDWKGYYSMDRGLVLKRRTRRKERTIETAGLVEGMPTGSHYNVLRFDDIETDDIAENPSQLNKAYSKFQMAQHLGMVTGDTLVTVAGTPYSHMGPVQIIRESKNSLGVPLYKTTIYPAEDENGQPVLMSRKQLDKFKILDHYRAQMMCDPSPTAGSDLRSVDIKEPLHAPPGLFKFMIVDPAGDKGDKADSDYWAYMVVGVERKKDEDGFSNVYILDMVIDREKEKYAPQNIANMFVNNNNVQALCVEQTNVGLLKYMVANILKAQHGIMLSEETNNLISLKPQGLGDKTTRIRRGLATPFSLGKIHMLRSIPYEYRERFKLQVDQFPFGAHDDGPDCLSWYRRILNTLYFDSMIEVQDIPKIDYRLPQKYRNCTAMAF